MNYAIVIERENNSYGAYVPDLPGCVAVGKSAAVVRKLIEQAISMHFADMPDRGTPIPRPTTVVETLEVPVPV